MSKISADAAVKEVVNSYIAAMHSWEVEAERRAGGLSIMERVELMEEMFNDGEAERLENSRKEILQKHCTAREYRSSGSWGTTTTHHPEGEQIVELKQVATDRFHIWTDYIDDRGFEYFWRYEVQLSDGAWLINQCYVLRDGEEFPEIW